MAALTALAATPVADAGGGFCTAVCGANVEPTDKTGVTYLLVLCLTLIVIKVIDKIFGAGGYFGGATAQDGEAWQLVDERNEAPQPVVTAEVETQTTPRCYRSAQSQSQCTYTELRGHAHPRFLPLPVQSHGSWIGTD